MRRILLLMIALGTARVLGAQTETSGSLFQPSEPVYVTGVKVPFFCNASGIVLLNAVISDTGKLERLDVRRSIPCLNELAVNAVGKWKFRPATWDGRPVAVSVPVAVMFRPPGLLTSRVANPKANAPGNGGGSQTAQFHPAEVAYAEYPHYPLTTIVAGTVILELKLTEAGKADTVKVLSDLPPLTEAAEAAAKTWRFAPATYRGRGVASNVILVFVSQPLFVTPR